jgi:hypothetical protein
MCVCVCVCVCVLCVLCWVYQLVSERVKVGEQACPTLVRHHTAPHTENTANKTLSHTQSHRTAHKQTRNPTEELVRREATRPVLQLREQPIHV